MTRLNHPKPWAKRPSSIVLLATAILVVRYFAGGAGPVALAAFELAAGSFAMFFVWSIYSPPKTHPDAEPVWRSLRWAAPVLFTFVLTNAATRIWPQAKDELISVNLWLVALVGVLLLWRARRLWRNPKAVRPGVIALAALGVALTLTPAAILRDWAKATEADLWSTISGALLLLILIALIVAVVAGVWCIFWSSGEAGESPQRDAA